jgi:hypothetical protein
MPIGLGLAPVFDVAIDGVDWAEKDVGDESGILMIDADVLHGC